MSALLPESLHALGWPAANVSAGLAEAVAGALAVLNASLAPPEPAPATPAPASAASAAPASAAPAHPPVRAIALALIIAAVFAAVTLEARDWLVRKRSMAFEQAFA